LTTHNFDKRQISIPLARYEPEIPASEPPHTYTVERASTWIFLNDFHMFKIASQLLFVCLFSCRYNPLWLYFHSPVAGFSLLVFEVCWSHTTTRHSR
jgi:hypothetical protein